jgi:DNA-binding NarL/FixJ family response regulator
MEANSTDGDTRHTRTTVLLADDVESLRRSIRRVLERDGRFEIVAEANDGIEAVEMAEQTQPDLVLLDLMMPKKAGPAAIREIREISPSSRIVVFSGLGAESAAELDIDGYLVKGMPPHEIIRSLERFVA